MLYIKYKKFQLKVQCYLNLELKPKINHIWAWSPHRSVQNYFFRKVTPSLELSHNNSGLALVLAT